ncbi:MAG: hypothetical protein V7K89_33135 [Nostoc sp.]|uniref:hypothetical protein n=1 Tax=Nostoc sp. TaxID=1180 RepID=UPI002FFBD9DF
MALIQGDIAFTSFNTDEDGWSIVTFVDIDPNTTIYFSDGTASSPTAIGSTDYGQYTGFRSGQASFVSNKAFVNNSANWTIDVGGNGATVIPNTTNFAIASENPTVNLSVNSNSGTEAETTSQNITITNKNSSILQKVGGFTSTNGAEISAFDPRSDRLFVVADFCAASNTVVVFASLTANFGTSEEI